MAYISKTQTGAKITAPAATTTSDNNDKHSWLARRNFIREHSEHCVAVIATIDGALRSRGFKEAPFFVGLSFGSEIILRQNFFAHFLAWTRFVGSYLVVVVELRPTRTSATSPMGACLITHKGSFVARRASNRKKKIPTEFWLARQRRCRSRLRGQVGIIVLAPSFVLKPFEYTFNHNHRRRRLILRQLQQQRRQHANAIRTRDAGDADDDRQDRRSAAHSDICAIAQASERAIEWTCQNLQFNSNPFNVSGARPLTYAELHV